MITFTSLFSVILKEFELTLTPTILQASKDLGLVKTNGQSSGISSLSKLSKVNSNGAIASTELLFPSIVSSQLHVSSFDDTCAGESIVMIWKYVKIRDKDDDFAVNVIEKVKTN